jgi:hypothetical protein
MESSSLEDGEGERIGGKKQWKECMEKENEFTFSTSFPCPWGEKIDEGDKREK